jgi:hypothetical protein
MSLEHILEKLIRQTVDAINFQQPRSNPRQPQSNDGETGDKSRDRRLPRRSTRHALIAASRKTSTTISAPGSPEGDVLKPAPGQQTPNWHGGKPNSAAGAAVHVTEDAIKADSPAEDHR